jgi:hypothetical protein
MDRFILTADTTKIELHGFADASQRAYGACFYVKSYNANNQTKCSLLCAKSKIAPIEHVTIPKLELSAATLLATLYNKVIKTLKTIDKTTLWTDSTIVLCWIQSENSSKQEQFVKNRTNKINELTKNCKWQHINSKSNPADIISRGYARRNY